MLLNQYRNHSKSTRLLYNKVGVVIIPPYPFTPKRKNGEGLYKVEDYLVMAFSIMVFADFDFLELQTSLYI